MNKYTIEDMQEIAKKRGGKCLSNEYINCKAHLEWQCENEHIWEAIPDSIINNKTWCPHCKVYYNEEKCRWILEQIYNKTFPKTRRLFSPYEIDGYCEELKLAFEYNGKQHYMHHEKWHQDKQDLVNQKNRDKIIKKLCKDNNIKLIVIPYFESRNDKNLEQYIFGELEIESFQINWKDFYSNLSILKQLQKLAKKRSGELISEIYGGSNKSLIWKCHKHNYEWSNSPAHIKEGQWCPKCGKEQLVNNAEGVRYLKDKNKYRAAIKFNNTEINLGLYYNENNALAIRKMAVEIFNNGDRNQQKYQSMAKKFKQNLKEEMKPKGRINNMKKSKGVIFNKDRNSFKSVIVVNNKTIHLGYYKTEEEAKEIRKLAVQLYESGERNPDEYKKLKENAKKP